MASHLPGCGRQEKVGGKRKVNNGRLEFVAVGQLMNTLKWDDLLGLGRINPAGYLASGK